MGTGAGRRPSYYEKSEWKSFETCKQTTQAEEKRWFERLHTPSIEAGIERAVAFGS